MTFVDSGAWYACLVADDVNHRRAVAWYAVNETPLCTTDYIVDESLTLLRSRGHHAAAIQFGNDAFSGKFGTLVYLTEADIRNAWDIFRTYTDKGWSFTDCTSYAVIVRLGLRQAFSFDSHFRQFGTISVVP